MVFNNYSIKVNSKLLNFVIMPFITTKYYYSRIIAIITTVNIIATDKLLPGTDC